jgi:hypothetical protein
VYIHELVDVVGTQRSRYQHHMTANWVPEVVGVRRQRCFGVFTVVGSTGRWPCVLNLWELDSWEDLAHDFELELSGAGHRDPILAEWWERAASFRTGGLDRIGVADDGAPGVQELTAGGGLGAVAHVHEVLRCAPGGAAELSRSLAGAVAADRRARGLAPLLTLRTAMRADDEVVAMWSVPDWRTWADFEAAAARGEAAVPDGAIDVSRTLVVDAELSPLRLGRQPTAADRRPLDERSEGRRASSRAGGGWGPGA